MDLLSSRLIPRRYRRGQNEDHERERRQGSEVGPSKDDRSYYRRAGVYAIDGYWLFPSVHGGRVQRLPDYDHEISSRSGDYSYRTKAGWWVDIRRYNSSLHGDDATFMITVQAHSEHVTALAGEAYLLSQIRYAIHEMRCRLGEPRARELLLELLNPRQRESLLRNGVFYMYGPSGAKYTLAHNQHVLCNGIPYCIVPEQRVPDYDRLAAIVLMLETDEPEFHRTAVRMW